jgi:hypothetical protein
MNEIKITMQPVVSSQIAAIGHDPDNNVLAIQFPPKKSTGVSDIYHYQGVGAELFAEFQAAASLGSFFIQRIKKFPEQFPYVKMDAAALTAAQLERDHAQALDINQRCYGEALQSGQRYSRNTFKDNGDPILLNADGKRSVFCDLCDDVEDAAA